MKSAYADISSSMAIRSLLVVGLILACAACGGTKKSVNAARSAMPPPSRASHALELIHFDTDTFTLNDEAMRALKDNVAWLGTHRDAVVVLEGHCDEWGDAAYNMQLGDRRARRVKAELIAKGIDEDRLIMVVSHGEERPRDERHTKDAWRMNRRVELIIR
jgi:outer membrane protein OmpA-like peptidoglycan-associated protein